MRRSSARTMQVLFGSVVGCLLLATAVAAQEPPSGPTGPPASPPPDVGAAVVEDPLTGPGLLWEGACPTQKNVGHFVGEGFIFKVTGKCTDTNTQHNIFRNLAGLTMADGELHFELRAVSGAERVQFRLWFRDQGNNAPSYVAYLEPGSGSVRLVRWSPTESVVLAERSDLGDRLAPDRWTSVAIRAQGSTLWVLLNDQPLLSAVDTTLDSGKVFLDLARLGPDDTAESAVVVRNLRVSNLASGDPARAPVYQTPQPRVGRMYFALSDDSTKRAENDVSEAQVTPNGRVWAFYDYEDVLPPNTLRAFWLSNGSTQGVSGTPQPAVPLNPIGPGRSSFSYGPNPPAVRGVLTFVVELNGQEAARRDLVVRAPG